MQVVYSWGNRLIKFCEVNKNRVTHIPWAAPLAWKGGSAILLVALGAAQAAVLKEDYPGATFNDPKLNSPVLGVYVLSTNFNAGGTSYTLTDNPLHPTFENDPSAAFLNIHNNEQSTLSNKLTYGQLYDFTVTGKNLNDGDLVVRSYAAFLNDKGSCGVDFYIENKGTKVAGAKVHWIQTLAGNNPLNGVAGTPFSKVDGGGQNPYYDATFDADSTFLSDDPHTPTSGLGAVSLYYNFETFLAYENSSYVLNNDGTVKTKGQVDIYDGVAWGMTIVPESSAPTLLLAGLALALGRLGGMRRAAKQA